MKIRKRKGMLLIFCALWVFGTSGNVLLFTPRLAIERRMAFRLPSSAKVLECTQHPLNSRGFFAKVSLSKEDFAMLERDLLTVFPRQLHTQEEIMEYVESGYPFALLRINHEAESERWGHIEWWDLKAESISAVFHNATPCTFSSLFGSRYQLHRRVYVVETEETVLLYLMSGRGN